MKKLTYMARCLSIALATLVLTHQAHAIQLSASSSDSAGITAAAQQSAPNWAEYYYQAKYDELITQVPAQAEFDALVYKIRALQKNKQSDEALTLLEAELKAQPTNAKALMLKGQILGNQASEASVFSALGLAKDAKKALQAAYDVDKQNPKLAQGIFEFLLYAPSIAGGDTDDAKLIANEVKKVDALAGEVMLLQHALADDNSKAAKTHLDTIAQLAQSAGTEEAKLKMLNAQVTYYLTQERYTEAISPLKAVVSMPEPADFDEKSQYYNAAYQLGRCTIKANEYHAEAEEALNRLVKYAGKSVLNKYQGYAYLRLAQLNELKKDLPQAKQFAQLALKFDAKDKELSKEAQKIIAIK